MKNIFIVAILSLFSVVNVACAEKKVASNNAACQGGVKSKYICGSTSELRPLGKIATIMPPADKSLRISFTEFKRVNGIPKSATRNTLGEPNKLYALYKRGTKDVKNRKKKVFSYDEYMANY